MPDEIKGELSGRIGSGWASLDTVDRHHTDNKAAHDEFTAEIAKLNTEKALNAQRWFHLDETLERIEKGVAAITPPPTTQWKVMTSAIPTFLSIVVAIAAAVYVVGKLPDPAAVTALFAASVKNDTAEQMTRVILDYQRRDLDDLLLRVRTLEGRHP